MIGGQMSIHIKKSHEGRLHRALHVPEDRKITQAKIMAAEHNRKATVRAEARFAAAAEKWHHPGK
jgi:hypothetical protein